MVMEKEPTSRQKQAAAAKRRIFFSAMALFEQDNFEAVSIAAIADAAGFSAGNFYHYFKSKEELLMYGYVMLDQVIEEEISPKEFPNNVTAIRALVLFQAFCSNRATARVMAQCLRVQLATLGKHSLEEDRWYRKHLKALVKAAIEAGEFRPDCDGEMAADAILRQAMGVLTDWAMRGGTYDIKEVTMNDLNQLLPQFLAVES